jgi:hypothetical protein
MIDDLEQFKSGDALTAERLNALVDHIKALTDLVAAQQAQLDAVSQRPRRRPLERIYRHVGLAKITGVGTGGNAGKYLWHEQYGGASAMNDFTDGRRAAAYTDSSVAKEVNGRTDIPVGTICGLYAFEQPDKFEYFIGPFFSSGGGGGLQVKLYECDDQNPAACVIEATPAEAFVSTLSFKSGCQVGDVRWTGNNAAEISGKVWRFGAKAPSSAWAHAPVGVTYTSVPTTTIEFDNSGNTGLGGTPADIEFKLTESNECRTTNGEICGGKIVTAYGIIKGGNGIDVWWDRTTAGDELDSQSPTKKVYLKDKSNSTTAGSKHFGLNFEVAGNVPNRKVTVEGKVSGGLNNLNDVDLDYAAADAASQHQYMLALDTDAGGNKYVRVNKLNLDVLTDVKWDTSVTPAILKQTKRKLRGWFYYDNATDSTIDTPVEDTRP